MDPEPSDHAACPRACFTFGIVTDVQYMDKDDGNNFQKTRTRYYRHSLNLLRSAIDAWNKEPVLPSFILQLGDVIDGFNARYLTSHLSLQTVLGEMDKSKAPFHHVWGNHEFYNFNRDYLNTSKLSSKQLEDETVPSLRHDGEDFYAYHFCPFPKFRFVIIDTYDLSVLGRETSQEKYQYSLKILKEKNKNGDLHDSDFPEIQFVEFNGGFSQEQLSWLNKVLTYSDENHEKVVVASHVPIHPEAAKSVCYAWNYSAVLSILHSHTCVVCCLSGHHHDGGYFLDSHGIHHIILEGIIETPPGSHAFGTMYVFEDQMILKGKGRTFSRVISY